MTDCTESAQQLQLIFDISGVKKISGSFDAGGISSDGGLILVRSADDKLRLSEQIALCLEDKRQSGKVKYKLVDLIRQRLNMIACGYEDLNDADKLANDPMHKICGGRNPDSDWDLASDSTLVRFENTDKDEQSKRDRQRELEQLQELLVHLYVQQQTKIPYRIVLDIDGACDVAHGQQQLSFYNGFYQANCFIPLFVFIGTFPVGAILRSGLAGPAEGTIDALKRIVKILRKAFPKVLIELRADAGFSEPDIYEYCEKSRIEYVIGLPSNKRLEKKSEHLIGITKKKFSDENGKDLPEKAESARVIEDVAYAAESWTKRRRIIARCDYTRHGIEFRYLVTNHRGGRASWLYEEKYCKRGRCENVIKELRSLKFDRLSCKDFQANQFRLLMHTFAYILLDTVRMASPASDRRFLLNTVRLRLIKIGVQVTETARRVYLNWSSSYPWQNAFNYTYARLTS
jgi:hypothetical protein